MNGNQLDLPLGLPTGGTAWDPAILGNVFEINEQLLRYLAQLALDEGRREHWPLLAQLQEQWQGLGEEGRQRLASCPYLLIDGGFADTQHWPAPTAPQVSDAPAPAPRLFGAEAVPLIRRMLLLAWHMARANRIAARVLLGMSGECADRLASYKLHELELLAELRPDWIKPRWSERLCVWRQLLLAARTEEPAELRRAQLRGVQLLASQLLLPGQERAAAVPRARRA
ncbi:MAG TPA: hypothetical protein VMI92_08940 [Steroidobacteraceae bacterium]|nr:hypothetical protein [Steroidobacteraceae bacterium]